MSRIWLGIGILALFLTVGLWSSFSMNALHKPIAQELELAAETALDGDLDAGAALARKSKKTWDAHWHGTAAFTDHTPMDDIDAQFARLDTYAQAGHPADFAAHCAQLSKLIQATAEAHSLTWWNLL